MPSVLCWPMHFVKQDQDSWWDMVPAVLHAVLHASVIVSCTAALLLGEVYAVPIINKQ